jgi:hypothetical protein
MAGRVNDLSRERGGERRNKGRQREINTKTKTDRGGNTDEWKLARETTTEESKELKQSL